MEASVAKVVAVVVGKVKVVVAEECQVVAAMVVAVVGAEAVAAVAAVVSTALAGSGTAGAALVARVLPEVSEVREVACQTAVAPVPVQVPMGAFGKRREAQPVETEANGAERGVCSAGCSTARRV